MAKATCRYCGGAIRAGETVDGEAIPLDDTPANTGPRYRVLSHKIVGGVHKDVVEAVPENHHVEGYVDHRLDCPGFANGVRR